MDAKFKNVSLPSFEDSDQKWMTVSAAVAAAACAAGAVVAIKLRAPVAVSAVLSAVALNCSAYVGQSLANRKRA